MRKVFELHANPDGLGFRAIVNWNSHHKDSRRNLRFDYEYQAEHAAKVRFHEKGQVCKIVPIWVE